MAIMQPYEMDFSDKNFSMIISGSPGIGKTTLALSAPEPILIDFDRGISRVKAQHRKTTIVCKNYEEVLQDIESPEAQAAKTIVIDTGGSFVTYLQEWAMRTNPTVNRQKNGTISLKGFGAVKEEFVRFTNLLQYAKNKNVIYIFHTTEGKDGETVKQRLLCEGAARNLVWQPCDLGCYMYMQGDDRMLGFTPTEQYFAKGCFGIHGVTKVPELTPDTPNDYLTRLFDMARENIAAEGKMYETDKAQYETAITKGTALVYSINTPEDAMKVTEEIRTMNHALTSRRELKTILNARLKEIGVKYDKETKAYVTVSNDAKPTK